jgi:predicted transcriptional regulator
MPDIRRNVRWHKESGMEHYQMGALETRFAQIIWRHEPVSSSELVKLAAEELNWKKSTTFTVLRRLCQKGIFQNQGSTVTSLFTEEGYASLRSTQFVQENFGGSLPAFLAAFSSRQKLKPEEIEQLRRMIEEQ